MTERTPATTTPDTSTGLPGVRSWRTIYVAVFAVFLVWIALLTWLTQHFTP